MLGHRPRRWPNIKPALLTWGSRVYRVASQHVYVTSIVWLRHKWYDQASLFCADTRRWPRVVSMLVHRLRRWPNIETARGQRLISAGMRGPNWPAPRVHNDLRYCSSTYTTRLFINTKKISFAWKTSANLVKIQYLISMPNKYETSFWCRFNGNP